MTEDRRRDARHRRGRPPDNERLIVRLRDRTLSHTERAALEEEIVSRNIGLVKSIAAKFISSGESLDDLIQAGYIGLLNAVANYDLAYETRFSTYATHLIQGEVRHYIRDRHSTIRIPQWVQTMNRRIKQAEEAYFQEEGRPPTLRELSAAVELTEAQLVALLRGREAMTYVSIDQGRRSSDPNPVPPSLDEVLLDSHALSMDTRARVVAAIEQLAQLQQHIVQGLFYEGKSQSEVGSELGMSQRQVSRMKDRALAELRRALQGGRAPDESGRGSAETRI